MFGADELEEELTGEDVQELRRHTAARLELWRGKAILSVGIFALSVCMVVPFLDGHSLHRYWEPFAKNLVWVSFALLVVMVYCVSSWYYAWRLHRDAEKIQAETKYLPAQE